MHRRHARPAVADDAAARSPHTRSPGSASRILLLAGLCFGGAALAATAFSRRVVPRSRGGRVPQRTGGSAGFDGPATLQPWLRRSGPPSDRGQRESGRGES